MPKFARPWPYHFELDGAPYLYPPPDVMAALNSSAYTRDSTEWFPPRQQQANISEAIFPPDAETGQSIVDRSGGFGRSDTHHVGGTDVDALESGYGYTDAVDAGTTGDGQGVDCSVEGVAFLGPRVMSVPLPEGLGDLAGNFELDDDDGTRRLYVWMGTKLFSSPDGETWTAIDLSGPASGSIPGEPIDYLQPSTPMRGHPAVFQGSADRPVAYFAYGSDIPFRAYRPGDDFLRRGESIDSPTDAASEDVDRWIDCCVVDDLLYVLWYDTATERYRVSSTGDGLAGVSPGLLGSSSPTYSASISISDGSDPARFLLYASDTIYIGCDRSLRTLDSERETLHEVLWTTTAPGENNFRWWTQWRDELWFTADQGEYRITADRRFQPIGPETLTGNRTPVRGVVRAKAGDDYCLYQFLRNNDGVTYLVKYREYDNGQRHAHHPISRIGTYDVNHAFLSTIDGVSPRIYFGVTGTEMRYIKLPRNGIYPPGDPLCEYTDKGQIFDTRMHGQLYFVNKSLFAHTARVEGLSATELVTPFYRTDTQTEFVQFGTEALDTDPGERIELGDPALCAWWEGRTRLQRGSTTTATPLLLATTWSFVYRPVAKGGYTVYVYAQDSLKNRASGLDRRTAADIITTLEALDSAQTPKFFVDPWGVRRQVYVNRVRYIDFTRDSDQWPTGVVMLTLVEFRDADAATWDDLEGLTWEEAESFTYDQLETLNP